jgi:hypothetical protein
VHHQRRFAGGRRTFERRAADGDENVVPGERLEHLTQPRRTRQGVKLGGIRHARRRRKVVVGTERDDQEIRLVGSTIGHHALGDGTGQVFRTHRMKFEFELSNYCKVTTATSNCPEQVGVFAFASSDPPAVRGNRLYRD